MVALPNVNPSTNALRIASSMPVLSNTIGAASGPTASAGLLHGPFGALELPGFCLLWRLALVDPYVPTGIIWLRAGSPPALPLPEEGLLAVGCALAPLCPLAEVPLAEVLLVPDDGLALGVLFLPARALDALLFLLVSCAEEQLLAAAALLFALCSSVAGAVAFSLREPGFHLPNLPLPRPLLGTLSTVILTGGRPSGCNWFVIIAPFMNAKLWFSPGGSRAGLSWLHPSRQVGQLGETLSQFSAHST